MKRKVGLIIFLLLIAAAITAALSFDNRALIPNNPIGKTMYYTQIDNTKCSKINETKYEYKLNSYSKKGKEKEISFTTKRELKDKAYLELYTTRLRGVTYWREVKLHEIPEKAQEKIE